MSVDRDSSVGIATRYVLDGPMGARFSALVHTGAEAQKASCKMGTGSLHQTSTAVKERVELPLLPLCAFTAGRMVTLLLYTR